MGYDTAVLRIGDVAPELAGAWDALPAGRGVQADFYDSHAYLASWCRVNGPGAAASLRLPAVLDGDSPVALLPLEARSRRRWESAATRAVDTDRARYRPVLGAERPDPEALGLLVEQVAGAGVRELVLNRMPARDPATEALQAALSASGFELHRRERSADCLALAEGGWEAHRRRFGSYDRSVRTKSNRLKSLWELQVEEYGPRTGLSVLDGFKLYEEIQRRSWKGPMPERVRQERVELLGRTEELGWCRLYVLRLAGVPAAGHVWFRLGPVAIWLSTAYDQRLAAISPGSILMWRAQERLFAESPLEVVDLLPGDNPQKDRLSPDRTPLLLIEAVRRSQVSGITFPVRRQVRYLAPRVVARARRKLAGRSPETAPPPAPRARRVQAAPDDARLPAAPLELDTAHRRALAALTGHASPEAMAQTWGEGDRWLLVGGGQPVAAVRVAAAGDGPVEVRELLLLAPGGVPVEEVLAAVAKAVTAPVVAELPTEAADGPVGAPIPVTTAVLPWPSAAT
jgi:CelD/BcsL family acetyltransferase involved in cellulose biosynthesis